MAEESEPEEAPPEEAPPEQAPPGGNAPRASDAALKLDVRDLSVTYVTEKNEKIPACKDVTFTIEDMPDKGEIVVFLGPSGCGKSTILKCAAGLLAPTKGAIYAQGQLIEGTSRDRGMVFQQYTSFAWLTVQDNVEYGLQASPAFREAERRERAKQGARRRWASRSSRTPIPKELSGGMKQRVAIARTVVNDPKLDA